MVVLTEDGVAGPEVGVGSVGCGVAVGLAGIGFGSAWIEVGLMSWGIRAEWIKAMASISDAVGGSFEVGGGPGTVGIGSGGKVVTPCSGKGISRVVGDVAAGTCAVSASLLKRMCREMAAGMSGCR